MKQDETMEKYIADKFEPVKEGNVVVYNVPVDSIADICKELYFEHHLPLKTITATDERNEGGGFRIYYVFGVPGENAFIAPYIVLKDEREFPSLTRYIHEASGYERRIKTFFGLDPAGHPQPRQITLHENWPDMSFPVTKRF